jgi:adenosine kinase
VSFLVPRMRKEFGGCAGNISYNLKLLGGHRCRWARSAGFRPYREHFTRCGST